MSRTTHFFYWADSPSAKLNELLESGNYHALPLQPIGGLTFSTRFHFSLFKQEALYLAVKSLPDDDLVCATDGFDVFFQRGQQDLEQAFNSFNADVVFSAERAYSHQYARPKSYFDRYAGSSPYRYLNAGGVVGRAGALRSLYKPSLWLRLRIMLFRIRAAGWLGDKLYALARRTGLVKTPPRTPTVRFIGPHRYTDQAYLAARMAQGAHGLRYALDRDCRLFWCTAFEWGDIESHYDVQNHLIVNRHTGNAPVAVHVPWDRKRPVFERLHNTSRALRATS